MADTSVSILDSAAVARLIDAQSIGTDFQQTVTLGDGANAGRVAKINPDGSQQVASNISTASTLTNVTSSITSVTIIAANTTRRGAVIFNDSTSALFISYNGGTAASATSFTTKIAAGGVTSMDIPIYTGAITGIWVTANGFARVTDFSA